jgi:hypothetical protein
MKRIWERIVRKLFPPPQFAADPIWFRIAALASVIFSLWAIQWEIRSK